MREIRNIPAGRSLSFRRCLGLSCLLFTAVNMEAQQIPLSGGTLMVERSIEGRGLVMRAAFKQGLPGAGRAILTGVNSGDQSAPDYEQHAFGSTWNQEDL